jgi:hypothetical protein
MSTTCSSSNIDVNKTDQNTIEKNIYMKILALLSSNAFRIIVPIGMEIITGVRNATPIIPYFFHNRTNFLDRGENTFLGG